KKNKITHLIVISRERRFQVLPDSLLVDQFIRLDLFRPDFLAEVKILLFLKTGVAESRSIDGLEGGLPEWSVDQGHARAVDGRKITILVVAHPGIEAKVVEQ